MIAFTGLVITMILLIIQFGSQAYSPRLVREVRNDWVLKHALATFVATFVFALATLNEIPRNGRVKFVPGAGLDAGLIFVAASIVAFLALIHRITTRFQLVNLLRLMEISHARRSSERTRTATSSPAMPGLRPSARLRRSSAIAVRRW
jgi:uncharacterized membrane protein